MVEKLRNVGNEESLRRCFKGFSGVHRGLRGIWPYGEYRGYPKP